jgi:dTDP-glucose 4,6-dehydratase
MNRKVINILVTGGAGFIGSAFIRYVLDKVPNFTGKCVNYDLLTYAGNLENLKSVEDDPRYVFVQGNICDEKKVEQICHEYKIDTIIHFAAESHVDRSILDPEAFLKTNVMGTFHILEVVKRNPKIHFHHVSTDEVYGCLGEEGLFTEETAYQPNSPYSASKAASDHLVRAYSKTYHLSTCISNCSNNYGPFQFPEKLIPLMILNCLKRKSLPVYGEGKNVRDWLFVDDHAECLWMLLEKGVSGETYNIGGEQEVRNIDMIHLIIANVAKILNIESSELLSLITYVKDRPGHDWRYAIDCSKVKQLGWTPSPSLQKRLIETIEWYINNPEWVNHVESGVYRQWIETNYQKR